MVNNIACLKQELKDTLQWVLAISSLMQILEADLCCVWITSKGILKLSCVVVLG